MKNAFIIKRIFTLLFILPVYNYGLAQIKTVIPANLKDAVEVNTQTPVSLTFKLNTLPANCKVTACWLQLVCKTNVTDVVQLNLLTADNVLINNSNLKKTVKDGSIISMNIDTRFIPVPATGDYTLKLQLLHALSRRVDFYPSKGQAIANQGNAPRLIIIYTLDHVPLTDWASTYANAQHTSQTQVEFRGATPRKFNIFPLSTMGDIQQNIVLYNDHLYEVDQNDPPQLHSFDLTGLGQKTISPTLSGTLNESAPVIDPFGRFYHATADRVAVTALATKSYRFIINSTGTINNSLTIGADGGLYIPSTQGIAAYSPYPENAILWFRPDGGAKKSAVTLNKEGTIAYLLSYTSGGTATLIALNANNGREIRNKPINLKIEAGETEPRVDFLPTLMVDDNGYIYVTNKIINASNLYVLDTALNFIDHRMTGNFSSPAGFIADSKVAGIYIINNGALREYMPGPNTSSLICDVSSDEVRSFVTDRSNNAYWITLNTQRFCYKFTTQDYKELFLNFTPQKNLVIGTDGTLYTATSKFIMAIKPIAYTADYELQNNTDQNTNNLGFTAQKLSIQPGFNFTNNKTLSASDGIIFKGTASLSKGADVLLKTDNSIGQGIIFRAGFSVQKGAVLTCKTGQLTVIPTQ